MSVETDALTPQDAAPGNPLRIPIPQNAIARAVVVWSRTEGKPVWRLPSELGATQASQP